MNADEKFVVVKNGQRVSENLDRSQAEAEAARQRKLQESQAQGQQADIQVKQSLVE